MFCRRNYYLTSVSSLCQTLEQSVNLNSKATAQRGYKIVIVRRIIINMFHTKVLRHKIEYNHYIIIIVITSLVAINTQYHKISFFSEAWHRRKHNSWCTVLK